MGTVNHYKTDIEIAYEAKLKKIDEIATELGLEEDDYERYGKYKAKLSLEIMNKRKGKEKKMEN